MKKNYLIALFIFFISASFSQSVYKDVATIFYAKCGSCHKPGGIANSDFTNYAGTAPYANTISNYITNGIMPPWPPDTTYTRFVHERTLSSTQKNAILQWINDGALPGNLSQVPPPPTYPKYQLQGTPDLILKIPTYTSTANAQDIYVCFALPTGLTQDRHLRAYEIVPGNPDIVHHVVVNVDTFGTSQSDLSGSCFNMPSNSFNIGDFAPGANPQIFPSVPPVKFGIKIKASSKIIMQMHYPAGTVGQQDSTQIRIYFYPPGETGIRPIFSTVALQNWLFSIPANTVQTVSAQYPSVGSIPYPVSIYSCFPHSHQICTSIENYADASTNKIKLIKINNWNFHWQGFYTYKKMVKIPAGYVFRGKHIYDNTTNNPNNPANPTPVTVSAGAFTNNEMLFDGFMWSVYLPGDENVDIEALLTNDPLLIGINENNQTSNLELINVFPNPTVNTVNIGFTLKQPQYIELSIFNVLGEKVKIISSSSESVGYTQKSWDITDNSGEKVAPGIYIYSLQVGEQTHSGKIIVNP